MKNLPLVFLPGLLCDNRIFEHQLQLFKDVDCQIMDLTQGNSMETLATQILEKAPPSFGLVGFSMGGYVAFEILRKAPARVKKLALISTKASLDEPNIMRLRRDQIALATRGKFKGITRQILPNLIHASRLQDHELTRNILDMGQAIGPHAFIAQETAIMGRTDSLPLLPHIHQLTYIIAGQQDHLSPPRHQAEMHRLMPHAHVFLLPDTGHIVPLERPAEMSKILREWYRAES